MAKKKVNQNQGLVAAYYNAQIILLGLLSLIAIGIYFWGAVQIDFVIRKNSELEKMRDALSRECDDLEIQINALQSYERIAREAKQQGIHMPSTQNVKEIKIDFSGIEYYYIGDDLGIRYADINPLGALRRSQARVKDGAQ